MKSATHSGFSDRNAKEKTGQSQAANLRPHKYRKIVESIVETNHFAIERAREEEHAPQKRHYNRNLQRWQADSHDTATWLYHLVFSTGSEPLNIPTLKSSGEAQSATVEDYDSGDSAPGADRGSVDDVPESSKLITWNDATKPSAVVDRLLHKWTTLSFDLIRASKTPHNPTQEAWGEGLIQEIQGYERSNRNSKKDGTYKDSYVFLGDYGSDYETEHEIGPIASSPEYSSDEGNYVSAEEESVVTETQPSYPPPERGSLHNNNGIKENKGKRSLPLRHDHLSNNLNRKRKERSRKSSQKTRIGDTHDKWGNYGDPARLSVQDNPFAPHFNRYSIPPPHSEQPHGPPFYSAPPVLGSNHNPHSFYSNPPLPPPPSAAVPPLLSAPPAPPSPPPLLIPSPPPPLPPAPPQEQSGRKIEETPNKDGRYKVPEDRKTQNNNNARFERLEALLLEEKMQSQKSEIKEEYLKLLSQNNESNEKKLERLEKLLSEHMEDQIRHQAEADASWRVEKAERQALYAKNALETRELGEVC